ncbi:Polyubiquitin-B [Babesia microti strain RI]|uniref:Polyubiquitin-B n=1 Tax=Babesia microti (strain RI) TaxID=1133968 RepID=A0A1N6LWZ7_BABMR|nr:Polyubiquitin-B [Babesia microti strain RI]SIO73392.1 Polyubiquitin-B [Babesia microti strain RI]|eukprot:XP_021337493.1 Polyubiquitin-B [Babesia microti strain RI]
MLRICVGTDITMAPWLMMWILLILSFDFIVVHGLGRNFEIKSLIGNHNIYVHNPKTVYDLKRIISDEINLPISHINIHNEGKMLSNKQIISPNDSKFGLSISLHGGIKLTVKTLTGSDITVDDVSEDDTVLTLKQKISKVQNMPIDHQRLIFNGKMLKNGKKLSEYKIKDNAVIHLVLRLRGGYTY